MHEGNEQEYARTRFCCCTGSTSDQSRSLAASCSAVALCKTGTVIPTGTNCDRWHPSILAWPLAVHLKPCFVLRGTHFIAQGPISLADGLQLFPYLRRPLRSCQSCIFSAPGLLFLLLRGNSLQFFEACLDSVIVKLHELVTLCDLSEKLSFSSKTHPFGHESSPALSLKAIWNKYLFNYPASSVIYTRESQRVIGISMCILSGICILFCNYYFLRKL